MIDRQTVVVIEELMPWFWNTVDYGIYSILVHAIAGGLHEGLVRVGIDVGLVQ